MYTSGRRHGGTVFGRFAAALCLVTVFLSCVATNHPVTLPSGLQYWTVIPGSGPRARPGDSVRIHETTTLVDGTLIYSTRTKGEPVTFVVGGSQVIAGVDLGVTGMKTGELRKLIVPPALSQRSTYPDNTPPDATLYYDIELVEIVHASTP